MMSNKSAGTRFEKEFVSILAQNCFWVHLFQDKISGQPCDVIAARNGHTFLFDCKDCKNSTFQLSRLEENQYNAMKLFELTGNSRGKLAIQFQEKGIFLIDYWKVKALRDKGTRQLDAADTALYGTELSRWLARRNAVDGWSEENGNQNQQ